MKQISFILVILFFFVHVGFSQTDNDSVIYKWQGEVRGPALSYFVTEIVFYPDSTYKRIDYDCGNKSEAVNYKEKSKDIQRGDWCAKGKYIILGQRLDNGLIDERFTLRKKRKTIRFVSKLTSGSYKPRKGIKLKRIN